MTMTAVRNPAHGGVIEEVPIQDHEVVDQVVTRANVAFRSWSRSSPRERGAVLGRLADLIRRDMERLASLESANTGKPISAARGEVAAAATTFEFYVGATDKVHGHTIPSHAPGTLLTWPVFISEL